MIIMLVLMTLVIQPVLPLVPVNILTSFVMIIMPVLMIAVVLLQDVYTLIIQLPVFHQISAVMQLVTKLKAVSLPILLIDATVMIYVMTMPAVQILVVPLFQ